MSISPGFIPASVIHDSTHPPAPSTREVSLRHLFLRNLFQDISGFHYVLLSHFFQSPYELGFQTELQLLIDRQELEEWELYCRYSPYVKECSLETEAFQASISIVFTDETELGLQFVLPEEMSQQDLLNVRDIFQNSYINRHGIKVSTAPWMFAYWFVQHCLRDQSLPVEYQIYFTSLSLEERYAILACVNETYQLGMKNLGQAFLLPASFKQTLIQLSQSKDGHGISNWVRSSWSYLSSLPETIFSKKSA